MWSWQPIWFGSSLPPSTSFLAPGLTPQALLGFFGKVAGCLVSSLVVFKWMFSEVLGFFAKKKRRRRGCWALDLRLRNQVSSPRSLSKAFLVFSSSLAGFFGFKKGSLAAFCWFKRDKKPLNHYLVLLFW